jgi:hypothetical protein
MAACVATGSALLATLTPGGLTLGLALLALAGLLYLHWTLVRILLQVRELLMLIAAQRHQANDDNRPPAAGADVRAAGLGLHADA